MLSYMQIHYFFVIPPILLMGLLYWPVLGRRDVFKMIWTCALATIWTTPWDNFILSHAGWSYPEGSIVGRIFYVPIEEHLFFIFQPIFLILLHSLIAHPQLIPFRIPSAISSSSTPLSEEEATSTSADADEKTGTTTSTSKRSIPMVQTLPRGIVAPAIWLVVMTIGGVLVHEAHGLELLPIDLGLGKRAFYLGWILFWISPVCAFLTFLGGQFGRAEVTALAIGSGWLWTVDTIALRSGSWAIAKNTTVGIDVWRGLPLEEAVFFALVSYLLILTSSLLSQLHTILLLSPEFPPCPPLSIPGHIAILGRAGFNPPPIDAGLLWGLRLAEDTLRKGSKSFEVAKLAFGREIRIGLVAVYAWCRVTDDLIDNAPTAAADTLEKSAILDVIREHLEAAFSGADEATLSQILSTIPDMTPQVHSAFHIFATLIPRLSPVEPFLELCKGYETDLKFLSIPETGEAAGRDILRARIQEKDFAVEDHLPIKTSEDLLQYADDVAGSIAAAICYLAWSVLDYHPAHSTRPVESLHWASDLHRNPSKLSLDSLSPRDGTRVSTVKAARTMGRALQLVNIARDVAKDAVISRVYVPLSSFSSAKSLLSILLPPSPNTSSSESSTSNSNSAEEYAQYNLPLLDQADEMRRSSEGAIASLPSTARGGARAMAASYFEIAEAIRQRGGRVDERGVKVEKKKRLKAAARAMWGLS